MLATYGFQAGERWAEEALRALEDLCAELECQTRRREPLARHTSMGVGGPCPVMFWPENPDAVRALCRWMGERGLRWRVLGGGSNLLVADEGVPEPVLNCSALTDHVQLSDRLAHFPAGTVTARALRLTAEAGLDGLVWAAGLPGTLGGAAAGNAGCWGGEMADIVEYLDVVDRAGSPWRLQANEIAWKYRTVALPTALDTGAVIVAVGLRLEPADPSDLRNRYRELQEKKRRRQPLGARNSGCIFRNPEGARGAGQLLDQAGCKGLRVGNAEISPVHANFIVNRRGATASDVLELTELVRNRVRERFGVELRPEIRRW